MRKRLVGFTHALWEGFKIAQRALMANKTRSMLTTLGIVIGVVTVTLMMMIIQGLNRSFANQISFLGSQTVYVDRYPWVWDDNWWKYINRPRITMDQYATVRDRTKYAEAVAPVLWTGRTVTFRDKTLGRVGVMGTTADYTIVANYLPDVGRFLNSADNRASRHVCVIGVDVQNELFGPLDPIGRDLRISGQNYRVVGILEKQGNFFGQSRDNIIVIPIETFLGQFGRRRSVEIVVKGRQDVEMERLTDELTGVMRHARLLRPLDEDNFSINQQGALQKVYKTITSGVYSAGLVIGGIALLVGGIGIMNIMLVSVTERTWEIGMRKAIGAKTAHILWQFLLESMMITMIGGTIGIVIAFLGGLLIKNQLPAVLPPWLAAAAVLFSGVVGIVFGLFPAAKAARMDPISALRSE